MIDTLTKIDTSLETMSNLDDILEQKGILERYKRKAIGLIERGKKIMTPMGMKQENLETEMDEIKNITFIVNRPQYDSALAEVIRALEILSQMDLGDIPLKNMENIVKLILAICTDCNTKVQSLHDTIAAMAEYIHELMILGYKIETLDTYKLGLEAEKQKLVVEISDLKSQIIRNQAYINKHIGVGPQTESELEGQVQHLKEKLKDM